MRDGIAHCDEDFGTTNTHPQDRIHRDSPQNSSEVPRRLALFEDRLRALGWRKGETLENGLPLELGRHAVQEQNIKDVLDAGCELVGGGSTPVAAAFLKKTSTVAFVFVR